MPKKQPPTYLYQIRGPNEELIAEFAFLIHAHEFAKMQTGAISIWRITTQEKLICRQAAKVSVDLSYA